MKKNSYLKIIKTKYNIKIIVDIDNLEKINKEILERDVKTLSKISKINKKINIVTNIDLNENNINDNNLFNFIVSLNVCKIKDKNKKLEYIYDSACKYLDLEFKNNNICGFKNDVCEANKNCNIKNGCCRQFSNKIFGLPIKNEFIECKYLKNKKCIANCLGCKLFCCDIIIKKGYKYTTNNVLLIKYYFNFIQKIIIKTKVFTPKEKILKILKIFNF